MFNNILLVCIGNICRSPTAEYLLKNRLQALGKTVQVESAGLGALVGKPADQEAQAVAAQHGIDLSPHIARQLDSQLIYRNDLILVMEESHIKGCEQITPAARGKTHLLGRWYNGIEIPDPYRKGDAAFINAFDLIQTSVDEWVSKVFK